MSDIRKPTDLVIGAEYRVTFEDCCVSGELISKFTGIDGQGFADGSGDENDYDALLFEHGQMTGPWYGITVAEVAELSGGAS